MAEMVASALVQEGVSGALSLAVSKREEKASQGHLMERLEMAQSELEFALERSSKMPITDVSLLRRRMMLKCAFKECTFVLRKHKDEEVEQRMVESGCSLLARYRFSNPIVTQVLEGKHLAYFSGQGKERFSLSIGPIRTEDHGVMAQLCFAYTDREAPMNSFGLGSLLRLSESTDIVGIITKLPDQLTKVFELRGTPDELIWTGVTKIPWYNNVKPPRPSFTFKRVAYLCSLESCGALATMQSKPPTM